MQLLGGRGELLRERRHLVRFALHGRDRATDLFDHLVETLLEKSQLVGLLRRRAHRKKPVLRFAHDAARAADALDERRRDLLEGHRDDHERDRLEHRRRSERRVPPVQQVVRLNGAEIRQGGREDQEIPDRVSLVEGVRQDGNEEGDDEAAVPEPDDEHGDEADVEQRQRINEPPAVPPALVYHVEQQVEDQPPARDEDHRPRTRPHGTDGPPDQAEGKPDAHQPPAPAEAARDGLDVLEPLLQARSLVRPPPHARGERGSRFRRRMCSHPGVIIHLR
ncbi:MAG: hypothetical protein DMD34_11380 [Gemmatimonadetes bacterium]|nr:MAG: hypothetical protein DMD34_11380 [Gemmatimonadota bacterium]